MTTAWYCEACQRSFPNSIEFDIHMKYYHAPGATWWIHEAVGYGFGK